MRLRPHATLLLAALLVAAPFASRAVASPLQFVPVDDPIVAELRVLDLYAPGNERGPLALPHLGAGPWTVAELLATLDARLPAGAPAHDVAARDIAARRVLRVLGREAGDGRGPQGVSPRLVQLAWPDDQRLELSAGLEGEADATRMGGTTSRSWQDGTGVHARIGAQVDHWLAYSHLWFGELRGVRAFSDALVANSDLAATTQESYLAYEGRHWEAQLGRSRWAWGPGEEGSLMLSRTSAPLTGFMLHARLAALHADAFVFSATVEPGTGEQLAAHRLEWQPRDGLRLGVSESARYHAGGWQGVYLAGVIPYAVAQRLLDQDHRDSTEALRNNVMVAVDASLRLADGSRVYGELLIDDLHARTADFPNKYGAQAGWSGTGAIGRSRLSWNTEYTWLSRFVYTSYFGRSYVAQGRPLGFPTGPDARRLRARVSWDPCVDWQLGLVAAKSDLGAGGLADVFVPGQSVPDVARLAAPETGTRSLDATLRWWPAGGVDLSTSAGRVWTSGASTAWRGALAFRLTR